MKKIICSVLIIFSLMLIVGCDKSYINSLDIVSNNENVTIIINDEELNNYNFNGRYFNWFPYTNYSSIDFTDINNNNLQTINCKFILKSTINHTYNLSLNITEDNKYVTDFLRVAIIMDNQVLVYKYYEENEHIYHKEDDPDTLLHFNSENEIFNNLSVDLLEGEEKEVVVIYWIEKAEFYNSKGEYKKGYSNKSSSATPIMLKLEIE